MGPSLNLIFCGTPAFAVPTLEKLHAGGSNVALVVTQPDRPRGRGLEFAPSPVKACAVSLGLPVTQPEKIKNNPQFQEQLSKLKPDAIIVVGYGRMIPQWMLDLPPLGNINLHASLLPKYRGAAPIQWAIARGEKTTGVSTMLIDSGLDTGPVLLQSEVGIAAEDTAETLGPRLASIGGELVVETLQGLKHKKIQPRPQDNAQASLAPILKKEDGRIDFHRPAQEIYNRLRGFQPWPGAFTSFGKKTLQVWAAKPVREGHAPGQLTVAGDRLFVGAGDGSALELLELQPEGKKRMRARDFIHGYHPATGEELGG